MQPILERINSLDELRKIVPMPKEIVKNKSINYLDATAQRFIKSSPFVLLSTGSNDRLDISPKGDPEGFVKILDKHTLAIPERRGNNRIDSCKNILRNSHVALLFFIPQINMTLRVSGNAFLAKDSWLCESMSVKGVQPKFATIIQVNHVMGHCGKSLIRSNLWSADTQQHNDVPSMAEMVIAHSGANEDELELQQHLDDSLVNRLY
jgi:PPOX class probable FMN-dependent enzyme